MIIGIFKYGPEDQVPVQVVIVHCHRHHHHHLLPHHLPHHFPHHRHHHLNLHLNLHQAAAATIENGGVVNWNTLIRRKKRTIDDIDASCNC